MAASAASEVVLRLNILGQAQFLRSMQASSDAVNAFADEVVSANERITASNDQLTSSSTETQDVLRTSAQGTADAVVSSQTEISDALARTAETSTSTTDTIVTNNERLAASADGTAAATNRLIGTAGSSASGAGGHGILGMLGSMKVLALGVGVYAGVNAFSKYQANLTLLTTQAGLAAYKLGAVRKEIGLLSAQTGMSKLNLSAGFYNPISEGFSVAQSAIVERYASELARMTGNPLGGQQGTSYALSTMLRTFGLAPTQANVAHTAAFMNAGVGAGDMTLSQLLSANGTGYFNTTGAYGISPQDAMGVLDFFSSQSVSPVDAATRARYFLSLLAAPSQQAQKFGMTLGLTQTQVTGAESQMAALGLMPSKMAYLLRQPGGVAKAMSLVNQSMAGMSATERVGVFSRLFGGGRTDSTALALAQHIGLLTQFTNRVGSMSTPQRLAQGWKMYQGTFAGQWGTFTSDLSNLAVTLGQTVVPAVEGLLHILGPLANVLAHNKVLVDGLAIALGGVLAVELGALALKIGSQVAGAFGTLSGAFDGLIARSIDLTGVMRTQGTVAGTTAGEIVAADGEISAASGGSVLGKAGLAAAAGALGYQAISSYDKGHPFGFGGGLWGTHYTGMHNGVPNYAGPGPMQLLHDLGQWLGHDSLAKPFSWLGGLASGGTLGGGFATNRPTAIVGEGGAHPEFVIPTDPAYRSRALGLYASLGTHLMASGGVLNGGVVQALASQGITGGAAGGLSALLASSAGLMGGLSGQNVAGIGTSVENAISTIVPPGGLRNLLLGLMSQLFMAAATSLSPGGPGAPGGISLAMPGTGGSPQGFAMALLRSLGDPTTSADVSSLVAWMGQEGGNWHNTARYNPLNTTLRMPGSSSMNGAGVQAYSSWHQGLMATIDTLRGGGYGDILAALASGKGLGQGSYAGLSRWSGGSYSSIPSGVYDSGGYLPEGLSLAYNGTGAPEPVGPVAAGAGAPQVIQLTVDGKVLAETVNHHNRAQMARR